MLLMGRHVLVDDWAEYFVEHALVEALVRVAVGQGQHPIQPMPCLGFVVLNFSRYVVFSNYIDV